MKIGIVFLMGTGVFAEGLFGFIRYVEDRFITGLDYGSMSKEDDRGNITGYRICV